MLKSELISNLTTRTTRNGYNYLLLDFAREYPSHQVEHFTLDYTNRSLPFEIENGKLFYMLSEDTHAFKQYDDEYNLIIRLTDSKQDNLDYSVRVNLINDDELFYTQATLTNKLYIDPIVRKDQLVGQVDVLAAFEAENTSEFTEIFRRPDQTRNFRFQVLNSNDHTGLFRVEPNSGIVFADKPVIKFDNEDKFKKLRVQVTGHVGHRPCEFLVDVYIFMRLHVTSSVLRRNPVKFEKDEFNTSVSVGVGRDVVGYFEPIEISRLTSADDDLAVIDTNVRYVILRNYQHDRCEMNWFNGKLRCQMGKGVDEERFSIQIATYDFHDRSLFDSTKVRITFFVTTLELISRANKIVNLFVCYLLIIGMFSWQVNQQLIFQYKLSILQFKIDH